MGIYTPKIITEEIERRFKPTRLAVKECNGIKYLCKSTRQDFEKYKGSGKHWKRIVKKYGRKNVKTLWVSDWFYCSHHIQEFALMYSEYNQVVESDEWANLKPENGLDGGMSSDVAKQIASRPGQKEIRTKAAREAACTTIARKRASDHMKKIHEQDGYTKMVNDKIREAMNRPEVKLKNAAAQKIAKNKPDAKLRVSGNNNGNYDHTVYEFRHNSGTLEICPRGELIAKYGLSKSKVADIIYNPTHTHRGWRRVT